LTVEEIARLSSEELMDIIVQARLVTMPTKLTPAERFGDLHREIQQTRDVIAKHREGHDISEGEIRRATFRAQCWGELAGMLAPFVGMALESALAQP
jgi:hypothetical protein